MNEILIFFKIRGVLKKSNETKLYFPRKKKNNEKNVNFLQVTWCVKKVTTLKLYLPIEKYTIISLYQTIKHPPGFYNKSPFQARLILKQYNIPLNLAEVRMVRITKTSPNIL